MFTLLNKLILNLKVAVVLLPIVFFCNQKTDTYKFPDSIKTKEYITKKKFYNITKFSNYPQNFILSKKYKIVLIPDSSILFIEHMPSLQGTPIAYQEWVSFAETQGISRKFIKNIGKKAVFFTTPPKWTFVIFYKDKNIFGVCTKEKNITIKLAKTWAN